MKDREKASGDEYNTVANMININPNISKIPLNVNGLHTPIKIQRLSEKINKARLNHRLSPSISL